MWNKINETYIPSDYVRRFQMDGNWDSDTGSGDWTFTNATFVSSSIWYTKENVQWGATTTFTYPSVTYTNSYIFKDGVFIKNSSEVTSTALNWVNWSEYALLTFFNRTLDKSEENALKLEWLKQLWPTHLLNRSQGFPKYSLRSLEEWKVLEISKAQSWGSYIDQTGNGNNGTPTNVTDSTVGLNNVMSFNGTSSLVSINDSPSLDITSEIYLSTRVNTTKLWTQYLIVKRTANVNDGYELSFSWSWKVFVRFNQSTQWNTYRLDSLSNYDTSWKWEKWEATYDWSTIKIYRNWVLDNSVSATFTIWTNNTALQLWKNTWGWYLQWQMCNPVVYNKSLSETEIQQLYYSNKLI